MKPGVFVLVPTGCYVRLYTTFLFIVTFKSNCCLLFTCLQPHARGGAQGGGDGREDGDGDVQNLLPDGLCFHVLEL